MVEAQRKKEKELMLILVTKAMDAKREAREALETETRRRKALKYKKNIRRHDQGAVMSCR